MYKEPTGFNGTGPFLLGFAIGAAAGLFYAPRSGREMRAQLAERARDGRERLSTAAEKGKEIVREGREVIERGGQAISSALSEGRAAYDRARTRESA